MTATFKVLTLILILYGLALLGLCKLNLERGKRYLQWKYVRLVFGFSLLLISLLGIYLPNSIDVILLNVSGIIPGFDSPGNILLTLNLLLLPPALTVKFFLLRTARRGAAREPAVPPPGYEFLRNVGIHLKKDWYFPGGALIACGYAALFPLLFMLIPYPLLISLPFFPILAVLVLLEAGWYLDGEPYKVETVTGGLAVENKGKFSDIWEKYQEIWGDRVLAAYRRRVDNGQEHQDAGRSLLKFKDLLARRKNILIRGQEHTGAFREALLRAWDTIIDGNNIVVFVRDGKDTEETVDYMRGALLALMPASKNVAQACSFSDMLTNGDMPRILVLTLQDVHYSGGCPRLKEFSRKTRLAIFPDSVAIFSAPLLAQLAVHYFTSYLPEDRLQVVVLESSRYHAETALKNIMARDFEDLLLPSTRPRHEEVLVWKNEGNESFQNRVFERSSTFHLGAEPVLSYLASVYKVRPLVQMEQHNLPWLQRCEELLNHRNQGFFMLRGDNASSDGLSEGVLEFQHRIWSRAPADDTFITARDAEFNFPRLLASLRVKGNTETFVQIVSPPYLLRDYLAANLEYFISEPVLEPFAPNPSRLSFTRALALLYFMMQGNQDERLLMPLIRDVDSGYVNAYEAIRDILFDYFGVTGPVAETMITMKRSFPFDPVAKAFVSKPIATFGLSQDIFNVAELSWLKRYVFYAEDNGIIGEIPAEHLHQFAFPGRYIALGGQPYRINDIDDHLMRVNLTPDHTASKDFIYRQNLTVSLRTNSDARPCRFYEKREIRGIQVEREMSESSYEVVCRGWLRYGDHLSIASKDIDYVPTAPVTRIYPHGRLFRLTIDSELSVGQNEAVAHALGLIISEMLPTLFPENHHLILCGSVVQAPGSFYSGMEALGRLAVNFSAAETHCFADCSAQVTLLAVEDSVSDLGMCQVLYESWEKVLELAYDYLDWVVEGAVLARSEVDGLEIRKGQRENNSFLLFGLERYAPALDPESVREFLARFGYASDENSITSSRKAFYEGRKTPYTISPDIIKGTVITEEFTVVSGGLDTTPHVCDYCARSAPANQMKKIHGLERCPVCGAAAIDSQEKLMSAYDEVRKFFGGNLRVTLRNGLQVRFETAETIHQHLQRSLNPTAGFDPRPVGFSIRDAGTICVELAAPKHAIMSTLVHELTHVWHDDNLDMAQMTLEMSEGLATWAEAEWLKVTGAAPEYLAMITSPSRMDEYGRGYRMVAEMISGSGGVSPFVLLLGKYPKKVSPN